MLRALVIGLDEVHDGLNVVVGYYDRPVHRFDMIFRHHFDRATRTSVRENCGRSVAVQRKFHKVSVTPDVVGLLKLAVHVFPDGCPAESTATI